MTFYPRPSAIDRIFSFLGNVKETINYKTSDLIDGANDDSVSFDNYYILHQGIKRLLFDL